MRVLLWTAQAIGHKTPPTHSDFSIRVGVVEINWQSERPAAEWTMAKLLLSFKVPVWALQRPFCPLKCQFHPLKCRFWGTEEPVHCKEGRKEKIKLPRTYSLSCCLSEPKPRGIALAAGADLRSRPATAEPCVYGNTPIEALQSPP